MSSPLDTFIANPYRLAGVDYFGNATPTLQRAWYADDDTTLGSTTLVDASGNGGNGTYQAAGDVASLVQGYIYGEDRAGLLAAHQFDSINANYLNLGQCGTLNGDIIGRGITIAFMAQWSTAGTLAIGGGNTTATLGVSKNGWRIQITATVITISLRDASGNLVQRAITRSTVPRWADGKPHLFIFKLKLVAGSSSADGTSGVIVACSVDLEPQTVDTTVSNATIAASGFTALTSGKAYGFAANIINGTASPSVPDNLVAQGLLMFTGILTEAQEVALASAYMYSAIGICCPYQAYGVFDFTDTTKTLHSGSAPTTGQTIDTVASLGGSTLTLSANTRTLAGAPYVTAYKKPLFTANGDADFVNFLAPTTTEVYSLQINNPSGWTFSSSRTSVLACAAPSNPFIQSITTGQVVAGMYAEVALGSASDQFWCGCLAVGNASNGDPQAYGLWYQTGAFTPQQAGNAGFRTPRNLPSFGVFGYCPGPVAQGGTDTAPFVMTDNARANAKKDYFGSPFGQYASGGYYNLSVSQSVLGYVGGITKDTAFSGRMKLIVLVDRQYITATEQAAFKSYCESRWPNECLADFRVRAVVNVHGDSIFSGVGATTDTKTTVPIGLLDSTVLNRTVFRSNCVGGATVANVTTRITGTWGSAYYGADADYPTATFADITEVGTNNSASAGATIYTALQGLVDAIRAKRAGTTVFSLGVRPSFSANTDTYNGLIVSNVNATVHDPDVSCVMPSYGTPDGTHPSTNTGKQQIADVLVDSLVSTFPAIFGASPARNLFIINGLSAN